MKVEVGIVGAGPAGLFLSHLLARGGISNVIVENCSQEHVEARQRAAVLEQRTIDLMTDLGFGDRLAQHGLAQEGIEFRFEKERFRLPLTKLTGGDARMMFYSQRDIVRDLLSARLAAGGNIIFGAEKVTIHHPSSLSPSIRYCEGRRERQIDCDFIVGCDGFHGVSRRTIPGRLLKEFNQSLPFAWLGILADVAPSTDEVIFARHRQGFAMYSIRPGGKSRLYLQVDPGDDIADWSDQRIWKELRERLAIDENWSLAEGPILEKAIIPLHSFVAEPMQFGRLFLAGDAAHIVPPVAAKGLNLAVADVKQLSDALLAFYEDGATALLDDYSRTALKRVWHAMYFSWDMSEMMHRATGSAYQDRVQTAKLRYIKNSPHCARAFAESYFGLTHE